MDTARTVTERVDECIITLLKVAEDGSKVSNERGWVGRGAGRGEN